MKQLTVLILGNSLYEFDSLPIQILPILKKKFPHVQFQLWDPTEEIPDNITENLILIDTIIGIKSVQVFDSLDDFLFSPRNTVHDFDVPIALGLLKKLGKVKEIKIIGIPPHACIHRILRKCEAQLMHGS
ncbi:MAG: hypothetical protein N3A54_01620 [Patescibacteria group bacterium]|nr:hypothetical protein [Patescibacteria group bacterium]